MTKFIDVLLLACDESTDPLEANRIVYAESFPTALHAHDRAKELQRMSQRRRRKLVLKLNPSWSDVFPQPVFTGVNLSEGFGDFDFGAGGVTANLSPPPISRGPGQANVWPDLESDSLETGRALCSSL
ncbi:MAG TPA: hypothetical protein PKA27_09765 [Fimbriimonadaceae bacterium]|nr:hypothetical protein [Fimbriimonadaceae bacterium]